MSCRELRRARAAAAPRVRLRGPVVRARLYATAHGLYEAEINGRRVGDDVLAPGWTSYDHRLRYQTYDVTALLRRAPTPSARRSPTAGTAAASASRRQAQPSTATAPALLAQLEIELRRRHRPTW